MQGMFAKFINDGVTSVIASLKADNDIGLLRQIVDDAALALIAPLRTYDCCNRHK